MTARIGVILGLVLAALLAAAPARALSNQEIANLKGPDRAAILDKGARAEGALTVYSSLIVDQVLRPLIEAFNKQYPYLKVDYWRGEARLDAAQRQQQPDPHQRGGDEVQQEQRSNRWDGREAVGGVLIEMIGAGRKQGTGAYGQHQVSEKRTRAS